MKNQNTSSATEHVIDEPEYVLEIEWEDRIFCDDDSVDFRQGEKSISFD